MNRASAEFKKNQPHDLHFFRYNVEFHANNHALSESWVIQRRTDGYKLVVETIMGNFSLRSVLQEHPLCSVLKYFTSGGLFE